MRKAAKTGFITGLTLSVTILLLITIIQTMQITHVATLLCIIVLPVVALWVAMKQYDDSLLKWRNLVLTGGIASITTSLLLSAASFVFASYIRPGFLTQFMEKASRFWQDKENSARTITGQIDWKWLKTPINFAISNFNIVLGLLLFLSIVIASVYYFKNRNRYSFHSPFKNPELIL